MHRKVDVIVIGGGASGLMVSQALSRNGAEVACLERSHKPGKKILISGGGRCNYTNLSTGPNNFLSSTKGFCYSALRGYSAEDAAEWFHSQGILPLEKKKGQLFCKDRAAFFLKSLIFSVTNSSGKIYNGVDVDVVLDQDAEFCVKTNQGNWEAKFLVVATGGISWPKLGVSDLGYKIAIQYGHEITSIAPGLVPLRLRKDEIWEPNLKGISLPVVVKCGRESYEDDLLMTHFGVSGPAALQISNHLKEGEIRFDLMPGVNVFDWITKRKSEGFRGDLKTLLSEKWPSRLAMSLGLKMTDGKVAHMKKEEIRKISSLINEWKPEVLGDMGYDKAEVTLGGVSCKEVSSKTMESKKRKGLYFIGEVLDVTGDLGGFNFQWAWSSAMACSRSIGQSSFD